MKWSINLTKSTKSSTRSKTAQTLDEDHEDARRHQFLRWGSVMGTVKNCIPRKDFAAIFSMEIPFNASSEEEKQLPSYTRSMSWRWRLRACCSIDRPAVLFFAGYLDADFVYLEPGNWSNTFRKRNVDMSRPPRSISTVVNEYWGLIWVWWWQRLLLEFLSSLSKIKHIQSDCWKPNIQPASSLFFPGQCKKDAREQRKGGVFSDEAPWIE